jgi:hypothetical protein
MPYIFFLERAIKFEAAVDHFTANHKDLCQYMLRSDDWKKHQARSGLASSLS